MSRYVCREHPFALVTWQGKGCRSCDAEKPPAKRHSPLPPKDRTPWYLRLEYRTHGGHSD